MFSLFKCILADNDKCQAISVLVYMYYDVMVFIKIVLKSLLWVEQQFLYTNSQKLTYTPLSNKVPFVQALLIVVNHSLML